MTGPKQKTIKIVHVIDSFGIGGMEKGIAMLINAAPPDFQHNIVCLSKSGGSERLLKHRVPIYEMNKPGGNSPGFVRALTRQIRKLKPCVVHTRNWGGMDGILAAAMAGAKAVVHGEHGWDATDADGLNKKRILLRRLLSVFVDRYICVSAHLRLWLQDTVGIGKQRIECIYNGIDTDLYKPEPDEPTLRKELQLGPEDKVVGIVGRLDPIKNHSLLIESFTRASRQYPEAKLLIAGDGTERSKLEALAGGNVILLGQRTDIPRLMRSFDIYVQPSRNEGISNTILEAMASALPVVATCVGGNPELVRHEHNGLLVDRNDPDGLASAIRRYLGNERLRSIHGANGRQFAVRKFSINSMRDSYHQVYADLTGNNLGGG